MTSRRKYDKQFKVDAVQLYKTSNKTILEIADDLGIHPGLLGRWIKEEKESRDTGKRAFSGQGNPRDEELSRLKKENADLRMERDILKKAMAIFTKPGK